MQGLSAAKILEAWERGQGRAPVERALALLTAGLPGASPRDLARLSLGQRDLLLLRLRELTLGSKLKGYTDCPSCGVTIDFGVMVDDIWFPAPDSPEAAGGAGAAGAGAGRTLLVARDGYEVEFRLIDSMDMAAAARCADVDKARALLLERAVRGAWHEGREVAIADLPDAVVAAVGERMEAGDPQAETPLVLVCGRCDHRWQLLLDVASFLWNEVSSLAERLLFDVQALARAYGWSEAEILGMSALRREFYLEHATKR